MLNSGLLTEEDIPEALTISLKELGSDYLNEKDFKDAIKSEKQFCAVVKNDGHVAGFAICKLFGPDDEFEYLRLPGSPEKKLICSKKKIGIFDSVSVSEDCRGMGVGTLLAEQCMRTFEDRETEIVTAMAWEDYTGHCNIKKILVNVMGMTESFAIRGYWNLFVDSPEGHDCPMCGAPCKCFGRLFYREM
jgi:GNAT superfamily N-acetyltransferase